MQKRKRLYALVTAILLSLLSSAALAGSVDFSQLQVKGDLSNPLLADAYIGYQAQIQQPHHTTRKWDGILLNQFQTSSKHIYISPYKAKILNLGGTLGYGYWTPEIPPASCRIELSSTQTLVVFGTLRSYNGTIEIDITKCQVVL